MLCANKKQKNEHKEKKETLILVLVHAKKKEKDEHGTITLVPIDILEKPRCKTPFGSVFGHKAAVR